MMANRRSFSQWLLPGVMILFFLEALLLPLAVSVTYSGRSESPSHTLTYTTGKLTWDSATGILPNGVAELNLFDSEYQHVSGTQGAKVVAPGMETVRIVRLENHADHPITYVAVMYRIRENQDLPVTPTLSGSGFVDTASYSLPQGVEPEQVVRAVTGVVEKGQLQDFDLSWLWRYYDSDSRDQVDTALGNQAAFAEAAQVTAGLYIIVEEEGSESPLVPDVPKTGDSGGMGAYLTLMGVSGLALALLLWESRHKPAEDAP